ncbi:LysO family transporter [Prevotella sp. HCN-7019]|uniref:LysO family transporter n=1 Tax=Prevotella sp. HCN-7019 TaxID=3134668 RepID=UPI0030C0F7A4
MFSIVMTMLAGVLIGHFLRNGKRVEKIEKSTSITIFVLLFVLGLSVGSNNVIIDNLGRFGWQAAVIAMLGMGGSIIAARIVFQLFFKKGEEKNEK